MTNSSEAERTVCRHSLKPRRLMCSFSVRSVGRGDDERRCGVGTDGHQDGDGAGTGERDGDEPEVGLEAGGERGRRTYG
jgi:hypothetical protein